MKLTRRDSIGLLVTALAIGLFTDVLTHQSIFGLNFLLWTTLWVAVLLFAAFDKRRLTPSFAIFGVFALVNAVMSYVRIEPVVAFWSFVITMVSLMMMAGSLYAPNFLALTIVNRFTELLTHGISTILANANEGFRTLNGNRKPVKLRGAVGIIIAVLLAVIFLALFAGADSVFSRQFGFLHDLFQWLGHYNVGRVVTICFWIAASAAGLLLIIGRLNPVKPTIHAMKKFLSGNDSTIILATVGVIFLIFSLFQLRYLFASGSLPDGLTYAEYARRGYGQLLLATLLASATVYGAMAWTADAVRLRARTWLATALVALNGFIVLSAWKRLSLYESAYGWTMARFVARLGLICIFLGSILLVLWVVRKMSTRRLFGFNWYMIATVLTVAAILNPAGIIVMKNITERASRSVSLDTDYLRSMSDDSLPAICKYAPQLRVNYTQEYDKLMEARRFTHVTIGTEDNHGLSRHYTRSAEFKQSITGCMLEAGVE